MSESSSSTGRRVTIENPSQALIDAIAAQVELPTDTATERWRVSGVRRVEADVQIVRTTIHDSERTTEQPIIWTNEVDATD